MRRASHATSSSNAEVKRLEAQRAHGTGALRTPCSGHSTRTGACST